MTAHSVPLRTLPGPIAHLDAITAVLDSGLTCLWLVPDTVVESGVADQLLDDLADRPGSIRVPPPKADGQWSRPAADFRAAEIDFTSDGQRPEWARDVFGLLTDDRWPPPAPDVVEALPPAPGPSLAERLAEMIDEPVDAADDPVRSLVGAAELRGRVVVVRAWEELDHAHTADLLVRLPAVLKELGVAPAERPRLLMASRLGDLPDGVLGLLDPVTTTVTWWWGALSRLDTAVVVALARSRRARDTPVEHPVREHVIREVITEVAGPDLELASQLAVTWDGRMDTLAADLPAQRTDVGTALAANYRPTTAKPPLQLHSTWTRGMVQLWDGEIRPDSAIIAANEWEGDLLTKIWRGQNRALSPVIDGHRARFEGIVRSRASMAVLTELTSSGDHGSQETPDPRRAVLELGPMAWAVGTHRVRIPAANLLFCLRDIRNLLAHLRPLDDQHLDRLTGLLRDPT
ncbi:MAG TPA: hypothetical protein VHX38_26465 [Pseudonocardiaceae bacterium]|jgi:hypothetical protein|nr:hypothetical protein [Pseudonocardiaceae bacterium]